MNVTLKDVPDTLHERLREAADKSGRSLNKLILQTLERAFCAPQSDRTALMERINRRRDGMSVWIDQPSLEAAIDEDQS